MARKKAQSSMMEYILMSFFMLLVIVVLIFFIGWWEFSKLNTQRATIDIQSSDELMSLFINSPHQDRGVDEQAHQLPYPGEGELGVR